MKMLRAFWNVDITYFQKKIYGINMQALTCQCVLTMAIKVYSTCQSQVTAFEIVDDSHIFLFSRNTVFNTTLNAIFYESRIFKEAIKIESCTAGRPKIDRIRSYFNYTRCSGGYRKLHHLHLYRRLSFGTLYDGSSSISSLLDSRVQALYKSIMDEMPGKSVMNT